jgi:transposase
MLQPVYVRGSTHYAQRLDGTVFERQWIFIARAGVWGWGPWHKSPLNTVPPNASLTRDHRARLPKG